MKLLTILVMLMIAATIVTINITCLNTPNTKMKSDDVDDVGGFYLYHVLTSP